MPVDESELPGTLQRSSAKAQRTYLQRVRERVACGPDGVRRAEARLREGRRPLGAEEEARPVRSAGAQGGCRARDQPKRTFGGVDVEGHTKAALYERAKKLDVADRSRMSKEELADAIARRQ
jgi:hypothetical protein